MKPDVDAIQDVVRPIITDQGKDVLLVVHSYGGVVGGESVRGLEKASREKQGKRGGISHLYYCCAFALPEGVSLMDALQGKNLPWFRVSEDQQIVTASRSRQDLLQRPAGTGQVYLHAEHAQLPDLPQQSHVPRVEVRS
jgi:hypothetical protein